LTKTYGSFTALSNLNLRLEGTKCVGFLGPNGAGKTTTLKIFTDLIRPSSGQAFIDGIDVQRHKMAALDRVGTLIETPEIYPAMTPNEALRLVAEVKGVPREERSKVIEGAGAEVRMEEWMDKRVGKFSKGMKQRICIAAALIGDPDILIFDEPTSGLDPRGMAEVRAIIKQLKNKDRLVFMSSHLLPEVTEVCEEVAMIDRGKLIVFDTITNVKSKFARTVDLADVGFLSGVDEALLARIRSLEGVSMAQKTSSDHISIKFEGGKPAQQRLFAQLGAMNVGAVSFSESASGLEEAYLNLIQETL